MAHWGRHSPFTLIELLVAAVAAAVLMAALVACLAGAWRLQEQGQDREASSTAMDMARQQLSEDLRAAVPPTGILSGPFVATSEEQGDLRRDDLQWVAALGARNPDASGGDLVRLHYYLIESGTAGPYHLIRTEKTNLLAVEEEELEEVALLDHVISFAASWYDGETWLDSWDSTIEENQLPEAGRIRIEFAEDAQIRAPPLEIVVPLLMRTVASGGGAP